MYALRIFALCTAAVISATPVHAQGARPLTASEFQFNNGGMVVMTPLLVDRYLLATRNRDVGGYDYWRSGGFNTQREFSLVEERVFAYLRIQYYEGVAGIFSAAEENALSKRQRDLLATRDRNRSDETAPEPETSVRSSGNSPENVRSSADPFENELRIMLYHGSGTINVVNRRATGNVRRPLTWVDRSAWIEAGNEISVPADTEILAELPDGSIMHVAENTVLKIEDLSNRPRFRLEQGEVTAKLTRSGSGIVVLTPYSQSQSVSQDTDFTVNCDLRTRVSATSVLEGSARVTNLATGTAVTVARGQRVDVTERSISEVLSGDSPSAPAAASPPKTGLGAVFGQILRDILVPPKSSAATTAETTAANTAANAGGDGWSANATAYRGRNGERFRFSCPAGGTASTIWGSDLYTDDSVVCSAAVHAGFIRMVGGGTVVIEMRPGAASYLGSNRNGVTSGNYGPWTGSYVFVP